MGRRGKARFIVIVRSGDRTHRPDPQRVGAHHVPRAAMEQACDIIRQWAASEGAIVPGTKLSIVDDVDGGEHFSVTYHGYEPDTLGGKDRWHALAQPRPVRKTPPL